MNVLVVHCHPDPDSFVASARDRVLAALDGAGHIVRVTDLYADGFDPCFDEHDRRTHLEPGTAPALQRHADDLRWCETLVLVYPTWWSGQPAMLKGWIDRVWANGVAWTMSSSGRAGASRLRPLLRNVRRIVVVTTHGSSKLVNSLQGEGGKRVVTRALRSLCSRRCRTTWVAMYGVDRSTADDRRAFLDRVERRLAAL
ncbi:MAG TPA: NAD(P)H-dependent oxidoreductase [Ilumatobacteraceae bacterium]|nr:NAD(P)H-dependent oxidoreductase [Ilumatobacteraceae bacterium]